MINNIEYDAIIVGAGHAGVEAALALARLDNKTLLTTLSLDALSFMACNPNIGGTAKGHLVREIDALGGEMGVNADKSILQLRMLNLSKGAAVHSLRGQADKHAYHINMKAVVENTPHLDLLQTEIVSLITDSDRVVGVINAMGDKYYAKAVILACGVYLDSKIIIGAFTKEEGPSGFSRAHGLTNCLIDLGFSIRRFKTGTPARIHSDSVDFSKMSIQDGDENIYPFSFLSDGVVSPNLPCYLTYTNEATHQIIRDNIHLAPLYNGSIKSIGPRYCPSIEDKVMRFADKDRHQIFIEPESMDTKELYVQGMSSSLPQDIQLEMYRTISGLERVKIMRYAYAIEYDCIDSTELYASLMSKTVKGLFFAGQINGSSGYEEAAAQGLMAGINAHLFMRNESPLILSRDEAYIGVLIDDLVTKGTMEPYRMMTARAEYRLHLRQENADIRLTAKGRAVGLVDDARYNRYLNKTRLLDEYSAVLNTIISPKEYAPLFDSVGESVSSSGISYKDMLKRNLITADLLIEYFPNLQYCDRRILREVATMIKYEGYLIKQTASIKELKKLEERRIPVDLEYNDIEGLRIEARLKLNKTKPDNLAQAGRISGVSPADITVLMVYLFKNNGKG